MGRDELVKSYHSLNEECNVLTKRVAELEAENERWVRRIKELERREEVAVAVLSGGLGDVVRDAMEMRELVARSEKAFQQPSEQEV